jgi:hypothetical protein
VLSFFSFFLFTNGSKMEKFKLKCYSASAAGTPAAFYLLSRGWHTGRPSYQPFVNSYAVFCSPADVQKYYHCIYGMWEAGAFRQYMRGSVIPFVTIGDVFAVIETTMKAMKDVDKRVKSLQAIHEMEQNLRERLRTLGEMKRCLYHLA